MTANRSRKTRSARGASWRRMIASVVALAVSFGGIVKEVCLAYLPEISVGEYTIVHVGFAITKVDEFVHLLFVFGC